MSDMNGANAVFDQARPVWFQGGTLGATVTRSIQVPKNNYLLLPMVNVINFDFGGRVSQFNFAVDVTYNLSVPEP